jgi:uncharacterized protein with NRDE domain
MVFDWRPGADGDSAALLTLAGNRDEYFKRDTLPLGIWADAPHVVAGRDIVGGGTWLGLTRDGRFAALTNYRAPAEFRADAPSRGALVSDFLIGPARAPLDYLASIAPRAAQYNGFNLLVGDWTRRELAWFSNRDPHTPLLLGPGVYGLSNALLDTPWPKVERKKADLLTYLDSVSRPSSTAACIAIGEHASLSGEALHAARMSSASGDGPLPPPVDASAVRFAADPALAPLIELMRDTRIAADADLPSTGLALEHERALSAAFIETPEYGSRSTTALRVDGDGTVAIAELSDDDGSHQLSRPGRVWRSASFTCVPALVRAIST